jgi:hypothetical protein
MAKGLRHEGRFRKAGLRDDQASSDEEEWIEISRRDETSSWRKDLSNRIGCERKFFLNFNPLIEIDNLDGSFDKIVCRV